MPDFCSVILKAISDYKLILKRTLPTAQFTSKLRELGLKRQYIREIDSDVGLYKVGLKIVDELRKHIETNDDRKSSNSYRGALSFLRYLEHVLVKHRIEDGKVINIDQKTTSALVSVTQLVSMSKGKLANDQIKQVLQYGDVVATCGSKEQKEMFLNVIKEYQANLLSKLPEEILLLDSSVLNANLSCRR